MIKTILCASAILAGVMITSRLALRAWDATMTDEELLTYVEKFPLDKSLSDLAAERGLTGHCDFEAMEKAGIDAEAEALKLLSEALESE